MQRQQGAAQDDGKVDQYDETREPGLTFAASAIAF